MANKVSEVDFQIRLANQRQMAKEHLRNIKKGYEKDMETIKQNTEGRIETKDEQYTEDKTRIVKGYEDKLQKSSDLTRLALNKSQRDKNVALSELEEQFEEERQMMRAEFRAEKENIIKSYREKLEAKDRELAEHKENIDKKTKVKIATFQEENQKMRNYYDEKVDEIHKDYEKQIDKIYEEMRAKG